jgi:hypothetical protein
MSKKKTKGLKPEQIPTGRPRTERAKVSSPTVPGATEEVDRVMDTIDVMRRRRQLDYRQFRAAEKVRAAYDVVHGSGGNTMDPDRVCGAGTPGRPPPQIYLDAAEVLREARNGLYALDRRILLMVAGEGCSIEECAGILWGVDPATGRALQVDAKDAGRRLRIALSELADLWFPGCVQSESRIRASRSTGAEGVVGGVDTYSIQRGRTAHATGRKVDHR